MFNSATLSGGIFLVTNAADSGDGSLRTALTDANTSGGGEILFSNVIGTIHLNSSLPEIAVNTQLRGPGADLLTISGNNSNRVLAFAAGTSNYIADIAIANGWTSGNRHGAGIFNAGVLTINRCSILNNTTSNAFGAGIYSSGTLLINNSTILTNIAKSREFYDPLPALGGGIYLDGSTGKFTNCRFVGNQVRGGSGTYEYVGFSGQFIVHPGSYVRGGGIYAYQAQITLSACVFEGNLAQTSIASFAMGGGIFGIDSTFQIKKCHLARNFAIGAGQGGAIAILKSIIGLDNSLIGPANWTSGTAYSSDAEGAGIFSSNSVLSVSNSSIIGNNASGYYGESDWRGPVSYAGDAKGSGLALYGGSNSVFNCLIATNKAFGGRGANGGSYEPRPPWPSTPGGTAAGAGLFASNGLVNIVNSTVSGNQASGGIAGYYSYCPFLLDCYYDTNSPGIGYGSVFFANGTTGIIASCTIVSNLAATSVDRPGFSGGIHNSNSHVTIQSTIIAGNQGTNGADIHGSILSLGYNLISISSPESAFTTTDIRSGNPRLGPLQDNGGPTWTHALLAGSPALDTGTSAGLATDQRGEPRNIDATSIPNALGGTGADIGAFEVDPVLRMKQTTWDGSNVVLRITSSAGKVYNLQYKINLSLPEWHTISGAFSGTGGIICLTNPLGNLPSSTPQFFRAFNR